MEDCPPKSTSPSRLAWPSLVANRLGVECVNRASPGASNLEILYHILNFDFRDTDEVVILWSFFARGAVINADGIEKYGLWLPNFKKWLGVRSYDHLITKSWLHIHHAELYLNSIGVKNTSYIIEQGYMNSKKPAYINVKNTEQTQGVFKEMKDLGTDNAHPGPETHKAFADVVYNNLTKENDHGND